MGFKLLLVAASLAWSLSGRILLQVQQHGEAWYIDPVTHTRFYMGTADDAYALLRSKGLGITHQLLSTYLATKFPVRLSGRILLDVQSHGEAYYVLPTTLKGVYLGTPTYAYDVMRKYGLGITDRDLAKIKIGGVPTTQDSNEQEAFTLVNNYRASKGLAPLQWDERIATIARAHSANMASGRVAFGHDGFTARVTAMNAFMTLREAAENVAYNQGYDDPAKEAVDGWVKSEGHRLNIEHASHNVSGMGVVKAADGSTYFTQLFATK